MTPDDLRGPSPVTSPSSGPIRATPGSATMPASSPPSAPPPRGLEVRGLTKRYGAVQALDDVSIAVSPGSPLAIVGENGAGKSTLVRIIAGLEIPDAGEIRLDGEPVRFTSPTDAQRAGIRIVPQELLLVPELSVAENVAMGSVPTSRRGIVDWPALRSLARARLDRLGLQDLDLDRQVRRLSVVERAFVQIARAMTPGARVLIVDEPTAPMGQAEVDRLLAVLDAVMAEGVAILYISHRLDEVFRLCRHAVVLRDGRLVGEFRDDALTSSALVSAMVGGRDLRVPTRADAGDAEPTLVVRDLTGGAVRGLSLDVRPGEIVAVYGVLGSGRDELGGLIAGAAPRSAGTVTMGGATLPPGDVRAAIAAGIGYVPAERRSQGLAMDLSVRENMTLGMLGQLADRGVFRRGVERAVVEEWSTKLRIATPTMDTPVRRLSGGSQQKVLIARWLAAGATVLLLEEPTRGVDIATKAEIYRLLRQRADEGSAILITSSDLEEVVTVADRVLVARRGRITGELRGATQEAVAAAALDTGRPEDDTDRGA